VNGLICVSLGCAVVHQFLASLELFCLTLCRLLLPCWLCFGGVSVPGPREVTEALWNTCCAVAAATDLTDFVHRSDRRRPSV
jgi:hypothetical protein